MSSTVPTPPPPDIRRRRVFFISGFDPRGPSHYHALYRAEAARQGDVTGIALQVGAAERIGRLVVRWRVDDPRGTVTEYEFLRWDDVIRANWERRRWRVARAYLATLAGMVVDGSLARIRRCNFGGWRTIVFPVSLQAGVALIALLAGLAAGWVVDGWWAAGGWAAVAGSGLAAAAVAWWAAQRLAAALNTDWIMRMITFCDRYAHDAVPGLDERAAAFAERITAALADRGLDEVLVVGHSLGAPLGVQAMRRVIAAGDAGADRRLVFLTIGQVIPMVSLRPAAEAFRRDLAVVGKPAGFTWADVSALPDRICFPLQDPLSGCGLPPTGRPLLTSARFHLQFPPLAYRILRENRYRVHFQYLMAAGRPAPTAFDYFAVTAGPHRYAAGAA